MNSAVVTLIWLWTIRFIQGLNLLIPQLIDFCNHLDEDFLNNVIDICVRRYFIFNQLAQDPIISPDQFFASLVILGFWICSIN